jgi:hypothetical protein
MQGIVRKMLIALGLVVVCGVILAATKAYGVWVITGIAAVLVFLGLLRKETPATGEEGAGEKPQTALSEGRERRDSHEA